MSTEEKSENKAKTVKKSTGEDDVPIETVKIGGLRSVMSRTRPKEQKTKVVEKNIGTKGLLAVDKNTAKKVFKDFAVELTKEKRVSLAAFFADPLIEVADNKVNFTVGSKLVAEEIKGERRRIIKLFANQGYELEALECIVNVAEINEYKVFTPKQQFEVMAKKYPMLKEFQYRFNLEIDG
ncbi:hypothetical protein N8368_03470 [Bacteroidia bacterium]|nr:hypothetical protein [Bacteroidia bacterium]MDC1395549.1 hypothetical protein [Bacteroidia bacterium]